MNVSAIVRAWFAVKRKDRVAHAPDELIGRAQEAARIMDHVLVQETVRAIETDYVRAWITTKPDEIDKREDIYRILRLLAKLTGDMRAIMADGDYARKKLELDKAERERAPSAV